MVGIKRLIALVTLLVILAGLLTSGIPDSNVPVAAPAFLVMR